jgi:(p)ppGpp synthase/HD superfamily hydrolase
MSQIVARAEAIARAAHDGQVDKAGRPYAEHPARVAARCAPDEEAMAAAWLHDVLEDTDVSAAQLLAHGIPEVVIAAVEALTRAENEQGDDYYARVAANPLALKVKRADLADNSDPGRLAALALQDRALAERLRAKYEHADTVLTQLTRDGGATAVVLD